MGWGRCLLLLLRCKSCLFSLLLLHSYYYSIHLHTHVPLSQITWIKFYSYFSPSSSFATPSHLCSQQPVTVINIIMNGTNGHHKSSITNSNEPHGVLESLGLVPSGLNDGLVSDAPIKAKGEVIDTYCPSTGQVLGQVQTVSRQMNKFWTACHTKNSECLRGTGSALLRTRSRWFSSQGLCHVANGTSTKAWRNIKRN